MSSSDDDDNYKMYKDRSQWSDVKPLPQDDGPAPVVQIAYSEKFKDVFDYFRAVLATNEMSERALELTKSAIGLNPANYTVWQYRRAILKALNKDIPTEMKFLSLIIMEQPKNYQVWHHRRALVEWTRDFSNELEFTAKIIDMDQKNYHAWQHRQWVIKEFSQWEEELVFVENLLDSDVRNNSAWNERYFVIEHTTGFTDQVIEREIDFAVKKIDVATKNESAWSYLRGVLQSKGLTWSGDLRSRVDSWRNEGLKSPHLSAFIIDILDQELENGACKKDQALNKVEELCKELAEETDPVRRKYWNFVAQRILRQHRVT